MAKSCTYKDIVLRFGVSCMITSNWSRKKCFQENNNTDWYFGKYVLHSASNSLSKERKQAWRPCKYCVAELFLLKSSKKLCSSRCLDKVEQ
jgi:hypothetical protein